MLSRLIAALVALATVVLVAPARADAQAAPLGRWQSSTINVYAPVPTAWGVGKAVTQWNKNGVVTLQLVREPCTGCITVREGLPPDQPHAAGQDIVGLAALWGPGEGRPIYGCDITLNPDHLYSGIMDPHGASAHELGHCLGLSHNAYTWSVMREIGPILFDRPTGRDLMRVARLYAHS